MNRHFFNDCKQLNRRIGGIFFFQDRPEFFIGVSKNEVGAIAVMFVSTYPSTKIHMHTFLHA
jgi:hypothetical protein